MGERAWARAYAAPTWRLHSRWLRGACSAAVGYVGCGKGALAELSDGGGRATRVCQHEQRAPELGRRKHHVQGARAALHHQQYDRHAFLRGIRAL